MKILELEKKVNEKIIELEYNTKHEGSKYDVETRVERIIEEILKTELPNTSFGVRTGFRYEQNRNRIYIYPNYEGYGSSRNSVVEIQIHKTLSYTSPRYGGKWYINGVTFSKENKDADLEDIYNTHKADIEQMLKERAEKEAREKAEREQALKELEERTNREIEEAKQYIEAHGLTIEEFRKHAYTVAHFSDRF